MLIITQATNVHIIDYYYTLYNDIKVCQIIFTSCLTNEMDFTYNKLVKHNLQTTYLAYKDSCSMNYDVCTESKYGTVSKYHYTNALLALLPQAY